MYIFGDEYHYKSNWGAEHRVITYDFSGLRNNFKRWTTVQLTHGWCVPTGAPANPRCRSWASMASCQVSATIEYFSSEKIGQGVFVNTIASMNRLATLKVAFWCWGTLWSPPAFGWGTLWSPAALGSGSAWVGTMSDSGNLLMVDFWRMSNGGARAPAACHRFGSDVRAMTVLARFHFFGSGTLVVRIILWRRA